MQIAIRNLRDWVCGAILGALFVPCVHPEWPNLRVVRRGIVVPPPFWVDFDITKMQANFNYFEGDI
jgi:hypothetical protein